MQLVEAGHRVLVWNEPGPELRTPIAKGRTVQELVEAVEGTLGPVPTEGGIETIGPVAVALEQPEQGRTVTGEEQVVPQGVAQVDAREQAEVRQVRRTAKGG